VANRVAIPLVTLLITPLALLGMLAPPLWQAGAWLVQALIVCLGWLAATLGAVWTAGAAPAWAQAAGLLGAVLLISPLPWRLRALALPLMAALLLPPQSRPGEGQMEVTLADVGQGSAALVRTRNHLPLHDAGPQYSPDSEAGTRVLLPLLRSQAARRIDLLMLSHRDADHVSGAAALLAGMPVAAMSSSLEASHPLRASGVPHTRCEAGQQWQWHGARFAVRHLPAADYQQPGAKPNAMSCVHQVTDAVGRSLLLTGDIEAEQERRLLLPAAAPVRSGALVMPHHGSQTSSTAAFLDAVQPRLAITRPATAIATPTRRPWSSTAMLNMALRCCTRMSAAPGHGDRAAAKTPATASATPSRVTGTTGRAAGPPSRIDRDLVLDQLDALGVRGDRPGGAALGCALGEARQHHGAIQGFDTDARAIDRLVVEQMGFHCAGDARVVDVGADGFLAARDGATHGRERDERGGDGGDCGANEHGRSPLK
jgi:beta-lactamase superfamily II metal-dependent hydrolase